MLRVSTSASLDSLESSEVRANYKVIIRVSVEIPVREPIWGGSHNTCHPLLVCFRRVTLLPVLLLQLHCLYAKVEF